jgi:hypothetical protein
MNKSACPQKRRPFNGDAGACTIGYYLVTDGVLKMCHENGRPTGKIYRLEPGDNERVIAARLTLEAWRRTANQSDFNRTLNYEKYGVA